MKENKDIQIKVRVSKSEKALIDEYCGKRSITISEFLRIAMNKCLQEEKK